MLDSLNEFLSNATFAFSTSRVSNEVQPLSARSLNVIVALPTVIFFSDVQFLIESVANTKFAPSRSIISSSEVALRIAFAERPVKPDGITSLTIWATVYVSWESSGSTIVITPSIVAAKASIVSSTVEI